MTHQAEFTVQSAGHRDMHNITQQVADAVQQSGIENGTPLLGTWQQIFHLECDIKPRSRRIVITLHGEPSRRTVQGD